MLPLRRRPVGISGLPQRLHPCRPQPLELTCRQRPPRARGVEQGAVRAGLRDSHAVLAGDAQVA